jgi:hypothetical protein
MGFTGLALSAMLARDGVADNDQGGKRESNADKKQEPTPSLAREPRAKAVIWIFLCGGVSHLESFDPKPMLNRYAGKTLDATPYRNLESASPDGGKISTSRELRGLAIGTRRFGQSGLEVADWWPQVGSCADDLAVIRSLWTTDTNHTAQLQFHTGRHGRERNHPSLGAWVLYGLGSARHNLPDYVVLGQPSNHRGIATALSAGSYLGQEYSGVGLNLEASQPLPFVEPAGGLPRSEQEAEFGLIGRLNRLAGIEYPDDPTLKAQIKSYELAFGMQTAVPDALKIGAEDRATQALYGLDRPETREFGTICLAARRLVERGVKFVQLFHGGRGSGLWDGHRRLRSTYTQLCREVDQPIAGLIKDMKRHGMLDETLVVWGTEFGRTPWTDVIAGTGQIADGRSHHVAGFSAWMAGGGLKRGVVHGATDELGLRAVEKRHYVTDLHSTVLHQLGIDPDRLDVPHHKRLERDRGRPILEIVDRANA